MEGKVTRNGCLLLVIGLPGSGKTSFVRRLVADLERAGHIKPYYIGLDDLIPLEKQKLSIDQGSSRWKELRKQFVVSCKAFVDTLLGDKSQACLQANEEKFLETIIQMNVMSTDSKSSTDFCFIVEDNFYYRSMREDFFRIAREAHLGLVMVMMETNLSECLQRNQSREQIVGEKIIHRMNEMFQRPRSDEFGSSSQNRVQVFTVSEEDPDTYSIIEMINRSLSNPLVEKREDNEMEEARERDRLINAESRVHRFDKILRKCVAMLLNGDPGNSNQYDGKNLSAVRKGLIKKFKEGSLDGIDLFSTKESTEENLIEICLKMIQREL